MNERPDPQELLPLTPLTLQVLVTLANEPLHGYAVVKEVREATEGRINPGTGTFYSAIHRMSDAGVIEEIDPPSNGDTRRRYYAISEFGREVLEAEAERLDRVVELARAARRG
jgi:DNA-binding PadR family transcriptional regulator